MEWNKYGFVAASNVRKKILVFLRKKPRMPSEISRNLSIDKSQVTRAIRELEKENLIICLTPNNKKGRVYGISHEGRLILGKLR